jgi:hypothetical protein
MTTKLAPHERPLLGDTSPEARLVLARVYRDMPPERKATIVGNLRQMTRQLFEAGYRTRNPNADERELADAWLRHTLEPELYEKARRVRDECERRSVERSPESGAAARKDEGALCAGGLAGQLGTGSTAFDE